MHLHICIASGLLSSALFLRYHSQAVRQSCRVLGTRQTSAVAAHIGKAFASLIPPVHIPALPPCTKGCIGY